MQVSNTNDSHSELLHWTHVINPTSYNGLASDIYSIRNKSGKLTLLISSKQKLTAEGAPYLAATFPGYTGDADTHLGFIRRSLERGLGILSVTPKWAPRTSEIRLNVLNLFQAFKNGPISTAGLNFIRGNSFGSFLSLSWMDELGHQVKKAAFISPCSAKQLPHAGEIIGQPVSDDLESFQAFLATLAELRIVLLNKDLIVPEIDPAFTTLSKRTEIMRADSNDHFTAGDLLIASEDIADWFAVGL